MDKSYYLNSTAQERFEISVLEHLTSIILPVLPTGKYYEEVSLQIVEELDRIISVTQRIKAEYLIRIKNNPSCDLVNQWNNYLESQDKQVNKP